MTDIIKIDPKEFGLEESKAADISAQFKPMLDKMVELEKEYNEVIALPIETAGPQAKTLRMKYVKVRTGTDKIHKEQKAFYLSAGRFVDGWKNTQLFASQGIEKKLEDIEEYAANKEKERVAALQSDREAALSPYGVENVSVLQLGAMTEEVFNNFLLGTKTTYDQKIESARIAEEARVAAAEAERVRLEEQARENERLRVEAKEVARLRAEEQAKAEAERRAAEEMLQAQRAEAARLAKEEADRQAAKIAAIEAANKLARDKAAKELEDQRAAAKKVADELQVRKDAEAKAEAERVTAAKKAAKAPIKEKMRVAINALSLDLPDSDITPDIITKYNGFKKWALSQIETL